MDEIATNESQRKLVFEAYKESWMRQLMADTSMTPAFLRFCLAIGFTRTASATAKPAATKQHPRWHRTNVHRALSRFAVSLGRISKTRGRRGM